MVGVLSQDYITPHNNLVNMIVLLEYFPTSRSVCIWNKLYACFYLNDVMNMSLFKILTKCGLHSGIVLFIEFIFSDQNYVCFKCKVL